MIAAAVATTGTLALVAEPASARPSLSVLLCVTPQQDGSPCAPPNTYRHLNEPVAIFATAASPPVGSMVSLWDANGTFVAACFDTNYCSATVNCSFPVAQTYVARVTWSGTSVGATSNLLRVTWQ